MKLVKIRNKQDKSYGFKKKGWERLSKDIKNKEMTHSDFCLSFM